MQISLQTLNLLILANNYSPFAPHALAPVARCLALIALLDFPSVESKCLICANVFPSRLSRPLIRKIRK